MSPREYVLWKIRYYVRRVRRRHTGAVSAEVWDFIIQTQPMTALVSIKFHVAKAALLGVLDGSNVFQGNQQRKRADCTNGPNKNPEKKIMSWEKAEKYHAKSNKVHQKASRAFMTRKLKRQKIRRQKKVAT
jgi:hypothetical protein